MADAARLRLFVGIDVADGRRREAEVVRRDEQRRRRVVVVHRLPDVSEVVDGDIVFARAQIQRHDIASPPAAVEEHVVVVRILQGRVRRAIEPIEARIGVISPGSPVRVARAGAADALAPQRRRDVRHPDSRRAVAGIRVGAVPRKEGGGADVAPVRCRIGERPHQDVAVEAHLARRDGRADRHGDHARCAALGRAKNRCVVPAVPAVLVRINHREVGAAGDAAPTVLTCVGGAVGDEAAGVAFVYAVIVVDVGTLVERGLDDVRRQNGNVGAGGRAGGFNLAVAARGEVVLIDRDEVRRAGGLPRNGDVVKHRRVGRVRCLLDSLHVKRESGDATRSFSKRIHKRERRRDVSRALPSAEIHSRTAGRRRRRMRRAEVGEGRRVGAGVEVDDGFVAHPRAGRDVVAAVILSVIGGARIRRVSSARDGAEEPSEGLAFPSFLASSVVIEA